MWQAGRSDGHTMIKGLGLGAPAMLLLVAVQGGQQLRGHVDGSCRRLAVPFAGCRGCLCRAVDDPAPHEALVWWLLVVDPPPPPGDNHCSLLLPVQHAPHSSNSPAPLLACGGPGSGVAAWLLSSPTAAVTRGGRQAATQTHSTTVSGHNRTSTHACKGPKASKHCCSPFPEARSTCQEGWVGQTLLRGESGGSTAAAWRRASALFEQEGQRAFPSRPSAVQHWHLEHVYISFELWLHTCAISATDLHRLGIAAHRNSDVGRRRQRRRCAVACLPTLQPSCA
jgi:hypothetical protein